MPIEIPLSASSSYKASANPVDLFSASMKHGHRKQQRQQQQQQYVNRKIYNTSVVDNSTSKVAGTTQQEQQAATLNSLMSLNYFPLQSHNHYNSNDHFSPLSPYQNHYNRGDHSSINFFNNIHNLQLNNKNTNNSGNNNFTSFQQLQQEHPISESITNNQAISTCNRFPSPSSARGNPTSPLLLLSSSSSSLDCSLTSSLNCSLSISTDGDNNDVILSESIAAAVAASSAKRKNKHHNSSNCKSNNGNNDCHISNNHHDSKRVNSPNIITAPSAAAAGNGDYDHNAKLVSSVDYNPVSPLNLMKGKSFVGPSKRYIWNLNEEKPLGTGYTATVHKAWDLHTGISLAAKVVPKAKQRLLASDQYYRHLYTRLPKLSHSNLLQLYDFYEDDKSFYVISALCKGPDLVDYVLEFGPGTIPLETARNVMHQILSGLNQLHKSKILHRDVKLDNILFEDSKRTQIKIIDYDMGLLSDLRMQPRKLSSPDEVSIVGTKDYMAPECYKGLYSEASDLWSVGVILYIFLDGHFPFNFSRVTTTANEKDAKIISGNHLMNHHQHNESRNVLKRGVQISPVLRQKAPSAVDLMEKLLRYNRNDRIQSADEALAHPWFSEQNKIQYQQNGLGKEASNNNSIKKDSIKDTNNQYQLHNKTETKKQQQQKTIIAETKAKTLQEKKEVEISQQKKKHDKEMPSSSFIDKKLSDLLLLSSQLPFLSFPSINETEGIDDNNQNRNKYNKENNWSNDQLIKSPFLSPIKTNPTPTFLPPAVPSAFSFDPVRTFPHALLSAFPPLVSSIKDTPVNFHPSSSQSSFLPPSANSLSSSIPPQSSTLPAFPTLSPNTVSNSNKDPHSHADHHQDNSIVQNGDITDPHENDDFASIAGDVAYCDNDASTVVAANVGKAKMKFTAVAVTAPNHIATLEKDKTSDDNDLIENLLLPLVTPSSSSAEKVSPSPSTNDPDEGNFFSPFSDRLPSGSVFAGPAIPNVPKEPVLNLVHRINRDWHKGKPGLADFGTDFKTPAAATYKKSIEKNDYKQHHNFNSHFQQQEQNSVNRKTSNSGIGWQLAWESTDTGSVDDRIGTSSEFSLSSIPNEDKDDWEWIQYSTAVAILPSDVEISNHNKNYNHGKSKTNCDVNDSNICNNEELMRYETEEHNTTNLYQPLANIDPCNYKNQQFSNYGNDHLNNNNQLCDRYHQQQTGKVYQSQPKQQHQEQQQQQQQERIKYNQGQKQQLLSSSSSSSNQGNDRFIDSNLKHRNYGRFHLPPLNFDHKSSSTAENALLSKSSTFNGCLTSREGTKKVLPLLLPAATARELTSSSSSRSSRSNSKFSYVDSLLPFSLLSSFNPSSKNSRCNLSNSHTNPGAAPVSAAGERKSRRSSMLTPHLMYHSPPQTKQFKSHQEKVNLLSSLNGSSNKAKGIKKEF